MQPAIIQRFNITTFGKGQQPIIFLHGFGCSQIMWRYITPAFENEYKIILFDLIGSGKSDSSFYRKEKYSSLQGHADDVIEIIETLELRDVIYVGHSISSMIGLLAALSSPELFSKLIMIGPSPCYINDKSYLGGFEKREIDEVLKVMKENMHNWAGFFAPKAMANVERPELAEELRESFCSTNPEITYQFAELTFLTDLRKQLPVLKTPTLIMQGSDDIIAPVKVGEYMHENISGSTLYIMKATGHYAHLSAPEETVELIQQYLVLE